MKTLKFLSQALILSSLTTFALSAAAAEKCKWKENCDCKAPGITMRWEYAYCMAKLGVTDAKEGAAKLAKCARAELPSGYEKMSACAKNQVWRTKFCELKGAGEGTACMTSNDEIPAFIEKGS